jgi:beta-phosphoglucomutase
MSESCVIFDFDGVIADTERLHLDAYNFALQAHAGRVGSEIFITPESYFTKYIVYGNREGFWHMLSDQGIAPAEELVDMLCDTKDEAFEDQLHDFSEPMPGVRQVLELLEEWNIPRAICSGGRRDEIIPLLEAFRLRSHFDAIITIEDVRMGKPDPEGYNKAFEMLYEEYDGMPRKERSLVIEDSAGGCAAGRAAGIRVLGVATSLPLERLQGVADFAVPDLSHVSAADLKRWLGKAT